ncbi:MAG: hypothetical protein ACUVRC_09485 [Desulfotomaculales bacterium]
MTVSGSAVLRHMQIRLAAIRAAPHRFGPTRAALVGWNESFAWFLASETGAEFFDARFLPEEGDFAGAVVVYIPRDGERKPGEGKNLLRFVEGGHFLLTMEVYPDPETFRLSCPARHHVDCVLRSEAI